MRTAYIYMIINVINGKFYIGSTNDIKKRWNDHLYCLNKNIHHSKHLQHAWSKYGEEAFEFEVLEEFEVEDSQEQFDREQIYLDLFKPWDSNIGYNISKKAEHGGFCGKTGEQHYNAKITEEQAIQIKKLIIEGKTNKEIKDIFNFNNTQIISNIGYGKAWKDAGQELNEECYKIYSYTRKGMRHITKDFIDNNKENILKLYFEDKLSTLEICEKYNLEENTLGKFISYEKARREGRIMICKHCGQEYVVKKGSCIKNKNNGKYKLPSRKYCYKCSKIINKEKSRVRMRKKRNKLTND